MTQTINIELLNQQIHEDSAFVDRLNSETAKVIVGQHDMIERLMLGLLTKGHLLLEGLPGLAKTLAIKTLHSCSIQPHSVYARPVARRRDWHHDLQSGAQ